MKKPLTLIILAFFSLSALANAGIPPASPPEPGDTSEVAKAQSLHTKVVSENRIIGSCGEAAALTLPQGISKEVGNTEFILVLETMSFSPTGAKLTAYMTAGVPRAEEKLGLKGKDINFAPGGFTGGARLELIGDANIKLSNNMTMVLKGDLNASKTFVDCDCKGYKSMSLQGEIQFSRDKLLPVGPDGKIIANNKVKVTAPFQTQLVGWDDFLLEVGISPFQVKDVKDFNFAVNSAVFDFSELANSPSMTFPKDYQSTDFVDGDQKMWKGFYLKDMVVNFTGLNDSASTGNKKVSPPPTFEAHNLLIDNMGLSGQFLGKDLIPIEEGTLGTWPFALDEITASISKNQLENCGLKGRITIPPLSDTTTLAFNAFIDPGNQYRFIVTTLNTIDMDMMMAKLRLDPNSSIDISVIEGKFRPKAILNGDLTIKTKETELAGIAFEELEIMPEAPYLRVKAFSFGTSKSKQKLGKFPIAISNIGMKTENDRTGLKFDLKLNLTESKSGGFTGETGLTIFGKRLIENESQKWRYDGIEVSKISIDIVGSAYTLKGYAQWFKNNNTYGNGFNGSVEATFKPGAKINATAIFGNINEMRYFYADALYESEKGLPFFGGTRLYALGGGVYHHMRQSGFEEIPVGTIGKSGSGIVYKPDPATAFGFKATVGIGLEKKEAFNAELTFEMAFEDDGGVKKIALEGNGYFMTPPVPANMQNLLDKCNKLSKGSDPNDPSSVKTGQQASISAHTKLVFDFTHNVTHGNLAVNINMPGDIVKGSGPNGLAGNAVVHFAPNEWYIHIGTPQQRLGITALNFAKLDAYFMMGTKIPASPPPPDRVTKKLGNINLDYMSDLNALGTGKGIAFGAGLNISTGNLAFKPFYAQFDAGAGFDVMLKNYGNANCKGQSDLLGINGWYANGQVWAYIQGNIGIRVDWRFIHGDYKILSVGAAALLQAKLPNPFWMRGIVGGEYSILGGLVSGNCRFDFTLGKECQIEGVGSPVQGMQVISEVTPNTGSTDVNVFTAPQAVFNMPIDKEFKLKDLDGKDASFTIQLDYFRIKDGANILKGSLEWNTEKDVVVFNPFEILPPEKQLTLEVQVSFKEKKNGSWQVVNNNGQPLTESMVSTFTTGVAPDYIPVSNVKYSYPLPMMFNYYKNESDLGYIQLKQGQDLFNPGAEWKQIGRFVDKQGNKYPFNFTYSAAERKVSFTRPANLKNNTIYSFELVNVPAVAKGDIDKNVVAIVDKKDLIIEGNKTEDNSSLEITTNDAEGTITDLEEKNIFETNFRTSLYNTLSEKIDHLVMGEGSQWALRPLVHLIYKGINSGERFDKYEVEGNTEILPNIQFTNVMDNTSWYIPYIYPYLYQNYPLNNSIYITNRTNEPVGLPPIHTVRIGMQNTIKNLTEQDLNFATIDTDIGLAAFHSFLVDYCEKDYKDLTTQVCAKLGDNSNISNSLLHLIQTPFPPVRKGDYKFMVNYMLPGLQQVSSTKQLTIKINY